MSSGERIYLTVLPPEKGSQDFLNSHSKPIMQGGKSYIRDSLNKSKTLDTIPDKSISVTADLVRL